MEGNTHDSRTLCYYKTNNDPAQTETLLTCELQKRLVTRYRDRGLLSAYPVKCRYFYRLTQTNLGTYFCVQVHKVATEETLVRVIEARLYFCSQYTFQTDATFILLKAKRNLLYIRNQSVPRSKHFPPRL